MIKNVLPPFYGSQCSTDSTCTTFDTDVNDNSGRPPTAEIASRFSPCTLCNVRVTRTHGGYQITTASRCGMLRPPDVLPTNFLSLGRPTGR